MKTINSTAEGYFYSCRFPCAGQCVLELQVSIATDTGTSRCRTKDIWDLRKTHMYKQWAKHCLLIKSPVHVLQCTLL